MLLKAGFTVTILDIAVMAMGLLVAKLLHLTHIPSGELVYALVGKFFYMIVINTLSFSIANLFINAKENFSHTILLSIGLLLFTLLGIVCFFGFNDNAHHFIASIIANPLPIAAVFLPIITAYATVYYLAVRAGKPALSE
jgi:hypothetical protein